MEIHKIISSGSQGNCIIYNRNIAVDMGIAFNKVAPYIKDISLLLLTHVHS